MNVLIVNKNKSILDGLDIEVIKRIEGEFTVDEIVETFRNFFFNKMIVDITAIKNYQDIMTLQKLSISFDMNKMILLLDSDSSFTTPDYLSKLISMGIYNFTTNVEGLMYLYNNPNSYRDVAQYHKIDSMIIEEEVSKPSVVTPSVVPLDPASSFNDVPVSSVSESFSDDSSDSLSSPVDASPVVLSKKRVIGVKSVTTGAGATTLVYLMKKHLERKYRVLAVEVEKRDFIYFNDKDLLSLSNSVIGETLTTNDDKDVILVDINGNPSVANFCTDVLYLVEPSIIKINRLLSIKPKILNELSGKKIVLCPSMLNDKDVKDFEYESKLKVFYNLKPIDDHAKNKEIDDLLVKLGFSKIK